MPTITKNAAMSNQIGYSTRCFFDYYLRHFGIFEAYWRTVCSQKIIFPMALTNKLAGKKEQTPSQIPYFSRRYRTR